MDIQKSIDKLYSISSDLKGYRRTIMVESIKNIIFELNSLSGHLNRLQSSRLSIKNNEYVSVVDKMVLILVCNGYTQDVILSLSDECLKFLARNRKLLTNASPENLIEINHAFVLFYTTYDRYPKDIEEFKNYIKQNNHD